MRFLKFFLISLALCTVLCTSEADDTAWPQARQEQKPWTRWWWPGSAVDKADLTRELEAFAAAGIGGVEITPIYGAKGYESRFITFLSPAYVDMLAHATKEAKRLGLAVDMATGTGWPFGAPHVKSEDAELRAEMRAGQLSIRPTGFKVKRAAPGGEGLVVNPYSVTALEHYLDPFTHALATLPAGAVHGQFHDSFEYTANWAADLPEKFQAMHGYDLRDHVAELGGQGDADTVARIKCDYRETLAQLHLDFVRAWADWARRFGQTAREQAHGAPGNLLDLYAAADVPETEIFGSSSFPIPGFRSEPAETGGHHPDLLINRFASSAAHVAGLPLVSSETFTWLREHFHESPSEMKPEVDQLFLAGINHIFYHGTCYSPDDVPWPGWLFYAATQFNPRNPLWPEFAGLNAYITRCQSLLQPGAPDNDVLVYWPVYDLWHDDTGWERKFSMHDQTWIDGTPCGKLMSALIAEGYGFDLISDAQLRQSRAVADSILTAGGASYRAVLVPRTEHMPLETFEQLIALARDGATVLFMDRPPADVSGFGSLKERRAKFKADLAELAGRELEQGNQKLFSVSIGRGLFFFGNALDTLLATTKAVREPSVDHGLGVLRRRTSDGNIYFIANLGARTFDGWLPLGRAFRGAVLFDALNDRSGVAASRVATTGAEIYLQLEPGESILVQTFANRPAEGAAWPYLKGRGAPIELSGPWHVTFVRGGPTLPPAFTTDRLLSWTEQGGEAERFAGAARYEIEFDLPTGAKADDWLLDLGDVRETARIFVNGAEVGDAWSLPFQTRIGAHLKPGRNRLAIEVTNLAANRIRDLDKRGVPWKNFYEINFVNIGYKPFDASNWPLQPSGLLGPVQLVPLKTFAP